MTFNINQYFDQRKPLREAFLQQYGYADVPLEAVGDDCAFRRYFRLNKDRKSLILMEIVPESDPLSTPGHHLSDFIEIGRWLNENGLHAPEIYEVDLENGYVLLEDLGSTSFKQAIKKGYDDQHLYGLAVDVLAELQKLDISQSGLSLISYYDSHVHKGRRRFVDWYMPTLKQEKNAEGLVTDYLNVWDRIENTVPQVHDSFLHIDFHFENLMLCDDQHGLRRCGILDYQGGMKGPAPYDLANLLEDARVYVDPSIRKIMLDRFVQGMDKSQAETFTARYRILATQFHCRVAGQFIKLAMRMGKPGYMDYVPRVLSYIRDALDDPVLEPLKLWLKENNIVIDPDADLDFANAATFISKDAF